MWNAGLDELHAGIKIAGQNISNLRYADDAILMAESEEELKSLLMRVKEQDEKAGLKLNIPKTNIMAFGSITSWQTAGEKVEGVTDFIFLDSKITVDGDCSYEIKRSLLHGRNIMTNLDSILKSRNYFANKSLSSQSYGFSSSHVQMWQLDHKESWTLKNWSFRTVGLEKTLESPLNCKKIKPVNPSGNQCWIFIQRTDAEAEAPIFWPSDAETTHCERPWGWERLKAKGEER